MRISEARRILGGGFALRLTDYSMFFAWVTVKSTRNQGRGYGYGTVVVRTTRVPVQEAGSSLLPVPHMPRRGQVSVGKAQYRRCTDLHVPKAMSDMLARGAQIAARRCITATGGEHAIECTVLANTRHVRATMMRASHQLRALAYNLSTWDRCPTLPPGAQ